MIYISDYLSPVGKITLAGRDGALTGLWIEGQSHFFSSKTDETEEKNIPVLACAKNWLDLYFAGEKPRPDALTLMPQGSAFRQEVWKLLLEIPYGKTETYGGLARRMAKITGKPKMSAQAVGGAVAHNPISIIIPCHRVIGADSAMTGYAGGIPLKTKLLSHEGVKIG